MLRIIAVSLSIAMELLITNPNLQCLLPVSPPLASSEQASKRRQAAAVQSHLDRANRDPRNPSQAIVYLYSEAGWCVWRRLCPQSLYARARGFPMPLAPAIAYTAPHAALANFGRARRCTACKQVSTFLYRIANCSLYDRSSCVSIADDRSPGIYTFIW